MNLLTIFLETLLPVMVLAVLGYVLQRTLRLDPRPLAQVVFYAFSPALVFSILVDIPVALTELARVAILVLLLMTVLAIIGWGMARAFGLSRTMTSAVILSVTFMNAGNLGLPVTHLAFGETGLAWASVVYATVNLATNSAGAWISSLGRTGPWRSLLGLAKVPAVYSIPLALGLRSLEVTLPQPVAIPIDLLAGAAIPSMLVLLGMQLGANGRAIRPRVLAGTAAVRLILSPALAWAVIWVLKLEPVAARATILEAAMPTAVLTSILASQYEVEPEFVSGAILLTTLLSPLTLAPLLLILQGL